MGYDDDKEKNYTIFCAAACKLFSSEKINVTCGGASFNFCSFLHKFEIMFKIKKKTFIKYFSLCYIWFYFLDIGR